SAFVLQTKLRPNEDAAAFEAQLEESFALLGVDVIDLLSFHGLNTPNCVELTRSEEHTSELQSLTNLACRLLLEKKKDTPTTHPVMRYSMRSQLPCEISNP